MAPVVVDEGDRAEESTNVALVKDPSDGKSEQESSSNSVGSSLVNSLKSSAKSATGLLPSSLLRSSKDQEAEGEAPLPGSEKGTDTAAEKVGEEERARVGADEAMEESDALGGTITADVTVEGWSVVDRCPEESESRSASGEVEEEAPESGSPSSSMQATHGLASSTVAQAEEIEEGSLTNPSVRSRSSSLRRSARSPASAGVSFVGAHTSRFSESIDIASIAERPSAFEPGHWDREEVGTKIQDDDGGDSVSMADNSSDSMGTKPRSLSLGRDERDAPVVNFVGARVSRFSESIDIASIAERPGAFEPQNDSLPAAAFVDAEVESQLQMEDASSVSNADSLQMDDADSVPYADSLQTEDAISASSADSPNALRRTKQEPEFRSVYYPELEDDVSSASNVSSSFSRETDDGVDAWTNRRAQPEDGGEAVTSSSDDFERKPSIPETTQRRGVYRMPGSEAEGEDHGGENAPQVLVQPAGFVVRAIEFQLNLIVHMIAFGIWLVSFSLSTISHPITRTVEVTDKVTSVTAGAANKVLEMFSYVGDGISQAGPNVGKVSKKTLWGCLGVAYVVCMLVLLLIPAVFVDIIIVNSMVEKPLVIRQALDFDFTQPRPVAMLSLFPAKEIERIKNLPVDKVVKTRVIPQGSKFQVTVVMTLPESDYNMKLGMFQVTAELLSARDRVILRSSKPCRLRYRSFLIQFVKTLVYGIPHLVGLSKEAQTIEIHLLEAEEKVIPCASVRILIEPKASFGGDAGVPEIYEAAIRLETILPWARGIISRWKWLFFLWNLLCVFLFEVAIVLCCCRKVLIPPFGRKTVAEEEIVQGELKHSRATRDVRSSRRVRSNRRVYFEDGIPGAEYSRPE